MENRRFDLTEEQYEEILVRLYHGLKLKEIADLFNVDFFDLYNLINRRDPEVLYGTLKDDAVPYITNNEEDNHNISITKIGIGIIVIIFAWFILSHVRGMRNDINAEIHRQSLPLCSTLYTREVRCPLTGTRINEQNRSQARREGRCRSH